MNKNNIFIFFVKKITATQYKAVRTHVQLLSTQPLQVCLILTDTQTLRYIEAGCALPKNGHSRALKGGGDT